MNKAPPIVNDAEHRALVVEVWKKVIQTQEHFNEICMKVRTLYATVVAAVLSVYGAFLRQAGDALQVQQFSISPIVPVSLAVVVVTSLFYFVDRYWYHRLLLGAVDQGKFIEDRWADVIPEIKMGAKISERSAVDLKHRPFVTWLAQRAVSDDKLKKNGSLHSDAKIEVFYKPIGAFALAVFIGAIFFRGVRIQGHSIAYHAAEAWERVAYDPSLSSAQRGTPTRP